MVLLILDLVLMELFGGGGLEVEFFVVFEDDRVVVGEIGDIDSCVVEVVNCVMMG